MLQTSMIDNDRASSYKSEARLRKESIDIQEMEKNKIINHLPK